MTQRIVVNRSQAEHTSMHVGKVGRDVYTMLATENLVTGITSIHPHSQTHGHAHPKREEHYYVLSGKGYVQLDDARYDIQAGDDVYVPPVSVHTVVNTGDQPLEFFWAAIAGEPKI